MKTFHKIFHSVLVFPPSCKRYVGPHNILCLQEVFVEGGCTEDGKEFPTEGNVHGIFLIEGSLK